MIGDGIGRNGSLSTSSSDIVKNRRYAVIGILDSACAVVVRRLQKATTLRTGNDLALRFPTHVTLRGRFLGTPKDVKHAFLRTRYRLSVPPQFVLIGPIFKHPELLWLTVDPAGPGHRMLAKLHQAFSAGLLPAIKHDETPKKYVGNGYVPHVTLGWGATLGLANERKPEQVVRLSCSISEIGLAEYPDDWPASGKVHVISRWKHQQYK